MSKYRNTVFYDFKSRFLVIFFSNFRHVLVLEIPFLNHIFPEISKYRTENLHIPSTGEYYAIIWRPFPLEATPLEQPNFLQLANICAFFSTIKAFCTKVFF